MSHCAGGLKVPEKTAIEVRMKHAEDRLDKHEAVHEKIWDKIDRPPVWMTLAFATVMGICGWLAHAAIT